MKKIIKMKKINKMSKVEISKIKAIFVKIKAAQCAFYTHVVLLSILIGVPLIISYLSCGDSCILFATGKWSAQNATLDITWSHGVVCLGPIVASFFVGGVTFVLGFRHMFLPIATSTRMLFHELVFDFVNNTLMLVFSLTTAMMLSSGIDVWCDSISDHFPSCRMIDGDKIYGFDNIDGPSLFNLLRLTKLAAWFTFAFNSGICVLAVIRMKFVQKLCNCSLSAIFREGAMLDIPEERPKKRIKPKRIVLTATEKGDV